MLQLFPSKLLHIERGSRLIGFSARVGAIKAICSAYLMCGRPVGHTQRSHLVSAVQILLGFPFDRQMNAEPCHTMWQPRRETCNNQHQICAYIQRVANFSLNVNSHRAVAGCQSAVSLSLSLSLYPSLSLCVCVCVCALVCVCSLRLCVCQSWQCLVRTICLSCGHN